MRRKVVHSFGLDDLIEHRVEFLANYQNKSYADRYRKSLSNFAARLPGSIEQNAITFGRRISI